MYLSIKADSRHMGERDNLKRQKIQKPTEVACH